MSDERHLDLEVVDPDPGLRTVIITWRVGEEPDIDATGIASWELLSLLDHCMDLVDVATEEIEAEAEGDD